MQNRRLTAIMFTDIVGYTAMMQDSEEKTLAVRETHRNIFQPTSEKHRGEIIQYFGDGTLSIFDNTFNAVNCGIDLQRQFTEAGIPTRIGIHVGEIIITENDIVGDAVNLAARVESVGIPGSVMITEKVHRELQNKDHFAFLPMGSIQFKNDKKVRNIFAVNAPGIHCPTEQEIAQFKTSIHKSKKPHHPDKKPKWNLPFAIIAFIILIVIAGIVGNRTLKKWHIEKSILPEIESLIEDINTVSTAGGTGKNIWPAFTKYEEVKEYFKNDKTFEKLGQDIFQLVDIDSEPQGAEIFAKGYSHPDSDWLFLGETPIHNVRLPYGFSRIKMEKEGYPVQQDIILNFIATENDRTFYFKLPPKISIPEDMAWVPEHTVIIEGESHNMSPFLMDKYEVTNEQYQEFIEAGGYHNPSFWDFDLNIDQDLFWNEVKPKFVDQTGRYGPSTWITGTYEQGKGGHPVTGISWYEAMAYARFVNKEIPTLDHFLSVKFEYGNKLRSVVECAELSNFESNGTIEVGTSDAVLRFGISDLAGNVREWIQNDVVIQNDIQKYILGGGYDDFIYMMDNISMTQDPENRHVTNGFRCIKILKATPYDSLFRRVIFSNQNENIEIPPMSDAEFANEIKRFQYDPTPFNDRIVYSKEGSDWNKTKIVLDPPYLGEELILYLYTPISSQPPYQMIIYWPGSNAIAAPSYEEYGQEKQITFLLKTGRAVLAPVLAGSYQRLEGKDATWKSVLWEEIWERRIKDIMRSIDYLITRDNIDSSRIGYYGISWGGNDGANVLAVEKRIKAAVLRVGGLSDPHHYDYLPRITTPVLMLNGKLDVIFPYETSQLPFYNLLGTPKPDKKLIAYDTEHLIPKTEAIRETLNWFDKYLGPVNRFLN